MKATESASTLSHDLKAPLRSTEEETDDVSTTASGSLGSRTPLSPCSPVEPEDVSEGRFHWQEAWSAVTMVLPSILLVCIAPSLSARADYPASVWVLTVSAMIHCPFSFVYHMVNAFRTNTKGHDAYRSPLRVGDLGTIHVTAVSYTWALSHGSMPQTLFAVLLNSISIGILVGNYVKSRPGGFLDNVRGFVCIVAFQCGMAFRGDATNFAWAMAWWCIGCCFMVISPYINEWGHGFFHLCLTPWAYYMAQSCALPI